MSTEISLAEKKQRFNFALSLQEVRTIVSRAHGSWTSSKYRKYYDPGDFQQVALDAVYKTCELLDPESSQREFISYLSRSVKNNCYIILIRPLKTQKRSMAKEVRWSDLYAEDYWSEFADEVDVEEQVFIKTLYEKIRAEVEDSDDTTLKKVFQSLLTSQKNEIKAIAQDLGISVPTYSKRLHLLRNIFSRYLTEY